MFQFVWNLLYGVKLDQFSIDNYVLLSLLYDQNQVNKKDANWESDTSIELSVKIG